MAVAVAAVAGTVLCIVISRSNFTLPSDFIAPGASGKARAISQADGRALVPAMLAKWLNLLLHLYAERVLPFDVTAARIAGGLADLARSKGQSPGFPDIAIAATAKAHGLTILIRKLKHFAVFGIAAHDLFRALPGERKRR